MKNYNEYGRNKGVIYGIDFGTRNSMIAVIDDRDAGPRIPDYENDCRLGVPMVFMVDEEGYEYCCDNAVKMDAEAEYPESTVISIKTRLKEDNIILNSKEYKPKYIAVQLAKRLFELTKEALHRSLDPAEEKEISVFASGVPVNFLAAENGEIRKIIKEVAGCEDENIHLIQEPVAGAIAYNYYAQKANAANKNDTLVFDIGSGTADFSYLIHNNDISPENPYPYICKEIGGTSIAGDFFDERFAHVFIEKLRDAGMPEKELKYMSEKNSPDRNRLIFEVRRIKENLSKTDKQRVRFDGYGIEVTREEFEKAIYKDMLENVAVAREVVRRALNSDRKKDINILLIGGSTYIPLVRQMLLEEFDWLDDKSIQQYLPEKAVALGAALYAMNPTVVPISSHGYAIETYSETEKKTVLNVHILPSVEVPQKFRAKYLPRKTGQDHVTFTVYELDEVTGKEYVDVDYGQKKEEYTLTHYFKTPSVVGTEVFLTVTLDENNMLTLEADDLTSVTKETFDVSIIKDGAIKIK